MTKVTGKDAPYSESIARFRANLNKLGIEVTESGWLNPLPHLFSVHLCVKNCPEICTNGKGSCREAALASAYGEMFERLSTHMAFADFFLGLDNSNAPFVHFKDEKWTIIPDVSPDTVPEPGQQPTLPTEILNASLRRFYSRDTGLKLEDLVDLQSSSFSRGVCSIPFENARNGEKVYFPINLLDNLYGSNGMSAGNTRYEALVQGFSEILERYTRREILRKGLTLPMIPDEILRRYPESYETLKGLQGRGLRAVCYDASLGGRFPVVCTVMFNQRNGTCCASFGAHPVFEVALDRTLTELMQGRSFSDLDNFDEPSFDLNRTGDEVNLISQFMDSTGVLPMQMFKSSPDFRFVAWDFSGGTREQYKAVHYIISRLGFDIYVRCYTALGVPVYRIIAPGMSEIYPLDDMTCNNLNRAIDFQESLLSLPDSNESRDTYRSYFEELDQEQFEDEALVCQVLGVLADPGSAWSTLRFGELKCLLALAAGLWERALELARWTATFNHGFFKLERMCFYHCLIKALECRIAGNLNEADYLDALSLIYGTQTATQVRGHLDGTSRFNALKGTDLNLKGFASHQELIKTYNLVKEAALDKNQQI